MLGRDLDDLNRYMKFRGLDAVASYRSLDDHGNGEFVFTTGDGEGVYPVAILVDDSSAKVVIRKNDGDGTAFEADYGVRYCMEGLRNASSEASAAMRDNPPVFPVAAPKPGM